jgi:Trehalase
MVPVDMTGTVMGGAVWLTLNQLKPDPGTVYEVWGDVNARLNAAAENQVNSPQGLAISTVPERRISFRLRLLNLSPLTDVYVRWRSAGQVWTNAAHLLDPLKQTARCAIKPDVKVWQEVSCYIDEDWRGSIDQIAVFLPERTRGDIWLDSVLVLDAEQPGLPTRPDIASPDVVPHVSIPGIDQAGFAAAFAVLDAALVLDVPKAGFTYPFISPGAGYQIGGWWLMDSSIALSAAKWTNQPFAENVMRGFIDVQAINPDGRLDLWGHAATRGMPADVSQMPSIFVYAFEIAQRTEDMTLRVDIYQMMRRYLDWWLSPVKREARTGLVSSLLEETLGAGNNSLPGNPEFSAQTVAGVDTNVAVAVGAHLTARLAKSLGRRQEATVYINAFQEIAEAINAYMWDEKDGVYYNYHLVARQVMRDRVVSSTFHPLKLNIAPKNRQERLLRRLVDPTEFNWGIRPLTTISKKSQDFSEAKGVYDGRGWYGDIWALRNEDVIIGLRDAGQNTLAAELNWAMVGEFHNNYCEFLVPSTGEGQGQRGFAWSAALYATSIIEKLFGLEVNLIDRQLCVCPYIPEALYGKEISISGLRLPTAELATISLSILQRDAKHATIRIVMSGSLPKCELRMGLPGCKMSSRPLRRTITLNL